MLHNVTGQRGREGKAGERSEAYQKAAREKRKLLSYDFDLELFHFSFCSLLLKKTTSHSHAAQAKYIHMPLSHIKTSKLLK